MTGDAQCVDHLLLGYSKSFAENPFYDQAKVIQMLEHVSKMSREEQSAADGLIMATLSMAVLQDKMKLSV